MTTYYIEQDNEIVLFDTDRSKLQATLKFMPKFAELEIKETDKRIIDFHFVDSSEAVESVRAKKLEELKAKFDEAGSEAHCTSSLGFEIDANPVSDRDITGVLVVMDDETTTQFCDYYNTFHEVTKAEMQTIQREIVLNGQFLYEQKWRLRETINAAQTVDELEAIEIVFTNRDFTA